MFRIRVGHDVALIAAAAFAAGCATPLDEEGAVAVVPYRLGENGHIIVETMVNDDGPFDFALDTASSITVTFDKLIEQMELDCVPERYVNVHGMVASGQFPLIRIDAIEVGGQRWSDVAVARLPGRTPACAEIDGILGVDFMRRYAIGIYAEERVISLYPPELVSARSYSGWSSIPLQPVEIGDAGAGLYTIDIRHAAVTIPAIFDLGANFNILNWEAARRLGAKRSVARHREEISGAVESAEVTGRLQLRSFRTGEASWRNQDFVIADLELFEAIDLDDQPAAIVGVRLFSRHDFIIDFARNRLLVRK